MNTLIPMLSLVAAVALSLTGCGKSDATKVDTRPVEKSFAAAEPGLKATAQRAVDAIQKGDWPTASAELQKLLAEARLTGEQKKAVAQVLEEVKQAMAALAQKAAAEANKAFEEVQKSLRK